MRQGLILFLTALFLILQQATCLCIELENTEPAARLYLTSDPPDGYLTLDGKATGRLPLWAEDIVPGYHDMRVSKGGFSHWFQKMYFAPGKEYWITAKLVKEAKMNRLKITSTPDGAEVFFDGVYRGNTLLTIYLIPVGVHDVRLSHETLKWQSEVFVGASDTLTIAAILEEDEFPQSQALPPDSSQRRVEGEISAAVSCHIEEVEGIPSSKLFLESEPPGAYLTLDRKRVGKLPRSIENLESGFHDIRLSLDGFDHWYQRMCIAPDNEYWITANMEKDAEMNRLEIVSIPNGAEVFLDTKYRGNTPMSIFLIPPGQHEVTLIQDQLSWHGEIVIQERETRMIEGELSELESVVFINSLLDSLVVYVDGNYMGVAPCEVTVPLGMRQFRYSRGDHHESTRGYFIKPGKKLTVNVQRIMDKELLAKQSSSYHSSRKRHLYTGLLSAGGSVLFYFLQKQAYDNYLAATTSSKIEESFDSARRNQIITLSLAGVSAYSFVRYFLVRKPDIKEYEQISESGY